MLVFLIITAILFSGFVLVLLGSSTKEIADNWPKYRCSPSVMPFAGFYGHDTGENFQFCIKNIFEGQADSLLGPFGAVLATFIGTLSTLIESANSMRIQMATLVGGVSNITSDLQDRITQVMFRVQITATRMKMLIGRLFATFYSMIYMSMSGITAVTNMGDTFLFGFLDTFCFPPETPVNMIGYSDPIPISAVKIGDRFEDTGSEVTATFSFLSDGQEMVRFPDGVEVSTNHYVDYNGTWIQARYHPKAKAIGPWTGGLARPLICLNTSDHTLSVGKQIFLDYDETKDGDELTMKMVEQQINNLMNQEISPVTDYSPSISATTHLRLADGTTQPAAAIQLGTRLPTGKVVGCIQKLVTHSCIHGDDLIHDSTLCWSDTRWVRVATLYPIRELETPQIFYSFIVAPSSTIELASGLTLRDYIEILSPDTESVYAQKIAESPSYPTTERVEVK
jgi:hypothetical protein